VDDIEKIMQVIDNEDVEDYLMLQEMRALKDEATISYEDFLKEIV
jgi:type III secretory pathway component EscV